MPAHRAIICLLALLFGIHVAPAATPDIPVIAAASSLQFALPEIASAFAQASGREVRLTFGSSGNFARQIRQGAPFQMFLSADESFVEALRAEGFAGTAGHVYGIGRIALLLPPASPLQADGTLSDLGAALAAGRVSRFAIANPEHAPYGQRAAEALRHAGLWEPIRDRLVLGESVSQAAQFSLSGAADGGIVSYSLAVSPALAGQSRHALIPQDFHSPLRQRMVLLKGAGETARQFYDFVRGADGGAILARHGFQPPGGSL